MGDGVMIWIGDAGDAVLLAAETLERVGTRTDLLPVRIGVHTGPAAAWRRLVRKRRQRSRPLGRSGQAERGSRERGDLGDRSLRIHRRSTSRASWCCAGSIAASRPGGWRDCRRHGCAQGPGAGAARGDLTIAQECYAADFVDHVNALDLHGHEGIRRSTDLYRALR